MTDDDGEIERAAAACVERLELRNDVDELARIVSRLSSTIEDTLEVVDRAVDELDVDMDAPVSDAVPPDEHTDTLRYLQ